MKNITKVTIFLLWLSAIFDPIGLHYGIRYVSLCMLLLTAIIIVITRRNVHTNSFIFVLMFCVVLPIYGLVHFSILSPDPLTDTSYISAGLLAISALLYYEQKLLNFGLETMFLMSVALACAILINAVWLLATGSWSLASYFTEHHIAVIGFRTYGPVTLPYMYFLAAPLLIPGYYMAFEKYYSTQNKKFILLVLIIGISMILIGTRASIALSALIPFVSISVHSRHRFVYLTSMLLFLIGFCLAYFEPIASAFDVTQGNNFEKLKDLRGYMTILNDPATILFGQGFNAHSWSEEFRPLLDGDLATKTELTYLEILRVYGIPLGLMVISFLVFLCIALFQYNKSSAAIVITLLINASFNPYLFSFNGILPISIYVARLGYLRHRY